MVKVVGLTKEEIEEKTKDLSDTLSQIGQAMYGSGQDKAGTQTKERPEEKKEDKKEEKKEEKVEEGEVVE